MIRPRMRVALALAAVGVIATPKVGAAKDVCATYIDQYVISNTYFFYKCSYVSGGGNCDACLYVCEDEGDYPNGPFLPISQCQS